MSTGTYLPVVRAGVWSWSTDVGSYASNVSAWGYIPGNLELTVGGSYNTSVVLGNARHANQSAGSSFTGAPTYGNVHTTSGPYSGSSANVNSLPVIYKSGSGDTRVAYNATWQTASTWYVPFAPSPVVQFAWSTYNPAEYPDANQFAWAGPASDGASWTQNYNWYQWASSWSSSSGQGWPYLRDTVCLNAYGILQEWGLGGYAWTSSSDYNNTARLTRIANKMPSNCAGRPLQLGNELDNAYDQGKMTLAEQFRLTFVYRGWPGMLMAPSYNSSHTYNKGNANVLNDPAQTSPVVLDTYYYSKTLEWSGTGQTFPFDALQLHHFVWEGPDFPDNPANVYNYYYNQQSPMGDQWALLADWKTYADSKGLDIYVTEYTTPPVGGVGGTCSTACIAARIDSLNYLLEQTLGARMKLRFWASWRSDYEDWEPTHLADSNGNWIDPVGIEYPPAHLRRGR